MLWRKIQHSWKGGQFDRELMGRTDLAKYPEAASELENFIVHRSGSISKRRGTDEIANLGDLVSGQAKLIPLPQSKDFGHYVLLSGGKAYLLSREGILLSDGSWARSVPSGSAARAIDVPYGDDELDALDYAQSGDTLFLAHRNHAPAKIVRSGDAIAYSPLDFAERHWAKPRVLKVENGGGTWGTGASKTVYYACTYVKDGIESEMSDPVEYTYKLPWNAGCTVNITCNKGNNLDEPDYYNIYKKESAEYGLIACEGKKVQTSASPNVTITGAVSVIPRLKHGDDVVNKANGPGEYVGTIPKSLLVSEADGTVTYQQDVYVRVGKDKYEHQWATRTRTIAHFNSLLVGGCGGGSSLVFSFGTASGTRVSDLTLALDAFTHAPYAPKNMQNSIAEAYAKDYDYDATIAYGGATSFTVKLTTADYNGTTKTFTQTVTVANPRGLTPSAGKVYWSSKGAKATVSGTALSWANITETGSDLVRELKVGFFDDVNAAYGKKSWQTNSIEITAKDSSGAACNLYWHGVTFGVSRVEAEVFQDDYITPDLTSTPPVFEDKFSTMRDYPGCVGIYQQRLCFASSRNAPFTFWMSCVGDLYNFATHESIREDDAIEATLAATEFPNINHLVTNRDLLMLSDGGEWKVAPVSGNTLSYKTVSADKQSAIGSSPVLRPLVIGDEIVFADRTGTVLRATKYSVLSEGYETTDLSVLSADIFRNRPIVSMAYQQSPDSIVWCVLDDGTLASLVYMKEHEMVAWSHHTLGGGFRAVAAATNQSSVRGTTETMLLVERGGSWRLWKIREAVDDGTRKTAVTLDGLRTVAPGTAGEDDEATVALGDGETAARGYVFEARMTTTRPETDPKEGALFEITNATEVAAMVLEGSTFSVKALSVGERAGSGREIELEPSGDGEEIALYTGLCRKTIYGDNRRDGRIVVVHAGVWPLTLLSLATTYQVEGENSTSKGGGE